MDFVLPWDLRGLVLPESRKQHLVIEHTVFFVLKHGDQSEVRLRMDPVAAKRIPFIDINHELNPYYQWLKSTQVCLEDRAPHLLPEGWNFWRKKRKIEEIEKKEETASLDGLLGHYDEDDSSPKALDQEKSLAPKPVTENTIKATKKDDGIAEKAIADLNALLCVYDDDTPSSSSRAQPPKTPPPPPLAHDIDGEDIVESNDEEAKNVRNVVISAPASTRVKETCAAQQKPPSPPFVIDDSMDSDSLLHSLLEYAENADIDDDVMAGLTGSSNCAAPPVAAEKSVPTPSASSTDDGRGSKAEKKKKEKQQQNESCDLLSALGAYSDSDSEKAAPAASEKVAPVASEKAAPTTTPWPKPSGKLKPDQVALILDIGVLLLKQPLPIVKLAKKVTWHEFSFLRGDEGAYFHEVVDVCLVKIENDEHLSVKERPIPGSLVGFFGKLVMERQKAVEKKVVQEVKPAGKVEVLATDEKQKKIEERRQRALKLLRQQEGEQRQ